MSNPDAQSAQAAHQALVEQLDLHSIHKTFRNPNWRPNQRRNKTIKAILGESQRKEASSTSAVATPRADDNGGGSGADTPANNDNNDGLSTSGTSTPANGNGSGAGTPASNGQPNLAQASRSLQKLVLEKSLASAQAPDKKAANGFASSAPTATYTNIESAPSLAPMKHYCDVTGLPAPYLDPKTRLRYHNKEIFAMIRNLPQGMGEQFLEARGAHTVLK
ncbi:uncharacterized protein CTHT_0032670 [Thermochaetoides thermophila DSM 1495]|uniref:Vps72/YL1 C-terminal domain-containing protein n=1 Tax=Chaetomium thermophilum (strain DSM 1495 / CBS 144.50 / IMI 039719) TaxID=759272 RepID=G0S590_CHATD|nr:hypothetical protein CTHT_0032670 [Thermochaetoides thermophila DSM 1495]6FHS_I Chain I, les6 [Thermochaetoides thermophila DSM 1495]6FML_I Chain I, Ies6 [Thermochaetoides thermophila DSM 1495]8AV6_I Chain I, YL1_C domain-containing protein [Thermochaetoides thermophila]8OO7_I Chain I, Chromatin-remodeling complex subunit IES6 [Thermochaetoides thermophila]8OOC_I Chain I, Vps72/YL1 C-terminal domain-containing protein [Thermochaetoides thermophila]8OOF_I Chain I, Chromatin-remodeling compl